MRSSFLSLVLIVSVGASRLKAPDALNEVLEKVVLLKTENVDDLSETFNKLRTAVIRVKDKPEMLDAEAVSAPAVFRFLMKFYEKKAIQRGRVVEVLKVLLASKWSSNLKADKDLMEQMKQVLPAQQQEAIGLHTIAEAPEEVPVEIPTAQEAESASELVVSVSTIVNIMNSKNHLSEMENKASDAFQSLRRACLHAKKEPIVFDQAATDASDVVRFLIELASMRKLMWKLVREVMVLLKISDKWSSAFDKEADFARSQLSTPILENLGWEASTPEEQVDDEPSQEEVQAQELDDVPERVELSPADVDEKEEPAANPPAQKSDDLPERTELPPAHVEEKKEKPLSRYIGRRFEIHSSSQRMWCPGVVTKITEGGNLYVEYYGLKPGVTLAKEVPIAGSSQIVRAPGQAFTVVQAQQWINEHRQSLPKQVAWSAQETHTYIKWFRQTQGDTKRMTSMFSSTGFPRKVLKGIWSVASSVFEKKPDGIFGWNEFEMACRLIAHLQADFQTGLTDEMSEGGPALIKYLLSKIDRPPSRLATFQTNTA